MCWYIFMILYSFIAPFRDAKICGMSSCAFHKSECAAGETGCWTLEHAQETRISKASQPKHQQAVHLINKLYYGPINVLNRVNLANTLKNEKDVLLAQSIGSPYTGEQDRSDNSSWAHHRRVSLTPPPRPSVGIWLKFLKRSRFVSGYK